jgi:tryptophan synthase alpha chain
MLTIVESFARARAEERLALVGYLPAGFPSPDAFLALARLALDSGLDLFEAGLPDKRSPIDGRVIREAVAQVRTSGITVDRALELSALACYRGRRGGYVLLNAETLAAYGAERLLARCTQLEIAGVLLVGAPFAQWQQFAAQATACGVQPIGFVPADADDDTVAATARNAEGMLYLQGHAGITGQRVQFGPQLRDQLGGVRACSDNKLPIAVGFGVRSAADIRRLRAYGADGAVVGTALVEAAAQGAAAVQTLVGELAAAAREPLARNCSV